jgi:2-oxoglutarate ferredoxin oxidoreductase subunit delta
MIQGRIVVDAERCKGCALCVSVCPQSVLALAERFNAAGYHPVRLVDAAGCTGCVLCALVCPEVAITVYRQRKAARASAPAAQAINPRQSAIGAGLWPWWPLSPMARGTDRGTDRFAASGL